MAGVFSFLDKVVDKVQDKVGDYVGKYIDSDIKPALRQTIDEGVAKFKADVLDKVPSAVSKELQEAPDSKVGAMIVQAFSGKLEKLLEGFLHYFQPEVDRTTASLTDTITDQSMTKVKAFLSVGGDDAPTEPGSREFQLPGVGQVDLTQTIGNLFNVDERLPALEKELRDQFQPIGNGLQTTLWDKLVQTLNAALNELMPWLNLPENRDLAANQEQSRDVGSWIADKIDDVTDSLKSNLAEHLPELYEAVKPHVDEIIAGLVKWLEDLSVSSAMGKVNDIAKKLDLLKPQ